MRRDSLVALLGDFVGLQHSPAFKPPRSPSPDKEKEKDNLKVVKKERPASVSELPDNHAELFLKSERAGRRQSEPAKHFLPRRKQSRKLSNTSEKSGTTIGSNPTSETSNGSQTNHKGSRRGSETLLGSIAVFSKPLVVINGRI